MVLFSFRDRELFMRRELRSSLKAIFGLGFSRANFIAVRFGLAFPFFSTSLNGYLITNILGLLNAILRSETKIRRATDLRIRLLQELGHWRGRRHLLFLPTRGQRSRTNARTQKRLRFSRKNVL
jgi:small subunit ribosomal protein S13